MKRKLARTIRACAALAVVACVSLSSGPAPSRPSHSARREADLERLIEVDRAFSRSARSLDLSEGIAAMFADDVVMIAPGKGFVHGRDRARLALAAISDKSGASATWTPLTGGISADGKHGFTLGYMRILPRDGSPRDEKYLAYWTRRPEGWRVALYRRKARPAGLTPAVALPPSLPRGKSGQASVAASRESLLAAERAFSADAGLAGLGEAFRRFGTPGSINAGSGTGFLLGAEGIATAVAAGAGAARLSWAPEDALVAPSGDLGVTWGWIRVEDVDPATPPIPYFTIWRRFAEGWRYAAE